jgi:hypothetical protein
MGGLVQGNSTEHGIVACSLAQFKSGVTRSALTGLGLLIISYGMAILTLNSVHIAPAIFETHPTPLVMMMKSFMMIDDGD